MERILFSAPARADIRRLDRDTALHIFAALHRLAEAGQGDVKRLKWETEELRLRAGDYRVRFTEESDTLYVNRVLHRKEPTIELWKRTVSALGMARGAAVEVSSFSCRGLTGLLF